MSERFHVNLPLSVGPFLLDGPEAHHLATVRRFRPGDSVCLFNGDGHEYLAKITRIARREIDLDIVAIEQPERELPFHLEVAAPIPKGDRGQFLLEKLTELGVSRYVPLNCERSNVHPRECKQEKLQRYVIEASKQCGRNQLMQIDEPTAWEVYCVRGNTEEIRLLAHPYNSVEIGALNRTNDQTVRIAVGPEGGFTDEELTAGFAAGWRSIFLGPRILRIETAAIVLAAHVSAAVSMARQEPTA